MTLKAPPPRQPTFVNRLPYFPRFDLGPCGFDQFKVILRLLRGAGDPVSGALVFAGQPRSTAALAFALDPSSLATPVRPEGGPSMEILADGLDEVDDLTVLRCFLLCSSFFLSGSGGDQKRVL